MLDLVLSLVFSSLTWYYGLVPEVVHVGVWVVPRATSDTVARPHTPSAPSIVHPTPICHGVRRHDGSGTGHHHWVDHSWIHLMR